MNPISSESKSNNIRLLVTNSFIVGDEGTYWDYRDYLFCLASNPSISNFPIRLNIERGIEKADEFVLTAREHSFTNFKIGTETPVSWASFMQEQVENNPTDWIMPWPGDHIYISEDKNALLSALEMGEKLNADAIAYSHVQDFEYLVDWDLIPILYNDDNYVMIEWGRKYQILHDWKFQKEIKRVINQELILPPAPGFLIYKTNIFSRILNALPENTTRWQHMEHSPAKEIWSYKVLIPKKCLYRHVHGYWLECFFKYRGTGGFPADIKSEVESWYIRSNYSRENQTPSTKEYRDICIKMHPYFSRYFNNIETLENNSINTTPFDRGWGQGYKTKSDVWLEMLMLLMRLKRYLVGRSHKLKRQFLKIPSRVESFSRKYSNRKNST